MRQSVDFRFVRFETEICLGGEIERNEEHAKGKEDSEILVVLEANVSVFSSSHS